MTQVKWRDFRENMADIINRVRFHNERIAITRHGKVVAELSPAHSEVRTPFPKSTAEA